MTNLTSNSSNLGWEIAGSNKRNLIKKTTLTDQSKIKSAAVSGGVKNITASNIRE
jgi:hypothetical protein